MSRSFNLADELKKAGVPVMGTRDQIVYLPYSCLVPDESNGYSMDGVEELARSIEIAGLQQPPRVRRIEDRPGFYRIFSGHRRHAAIGLLIERGSTLFKDGVPCIIDTSQASEALQELQLLLGNADNRKMTPADELQQADRISDCIRRLEDEGFEFSGRHRDWVSKLSGMSRTKLGRLQSIKNNLVPALFSYFESGQLNETAANELQKLPKEAQEAIAESCKRTGDAYFITYEGAAHCVKYAQRYMTPCKCGDGDECDHHERRFIQPLRVQYTWQRCTGECCLSCSELRSCKAACAKGRAKQKTDKEAEAAEASKEKDKRAREDAKRQAKFRLAMQEEAKRVLPLIEAAGLTGKNSLRGRYSYVTVKVSDIRKAAAGDFGDQYFYSDSMLPSDVEGLKEWADLLGCTMDFLVGRGNAPQMTVPTPGTDPVWQTGEPDEDAVGWYAVRVQAGGVSFTMRRYLWWTGGQFTRGPESVTPMIHKDDNVLGWFRLPDEEAET